MKTIQSLKQWRSSRWLAVLFSATGVMILCLGEWATALFELSLAFMWWYVDFLYGFNKRLEESRNHWVDWGTECLEVAKRVHAMNCDIEKKAMEIYSKEYNAKVRAALRELFGADTFKEKGGEK